MQSDWLSDARSPNARCKQPAILTSLTAKMIGIPAYVSACKHLQRVHQIPYMPHACVSSISWPGADPINRYIVCWLLCSRWNSLAINWHKINWVGSSKCSFFWWVSGTTSTCKAARFLKTVASSALELLSTAHAAQVVRPSISIYIKV